VGHCVSRNAANHSGQAIPLPPVVTVLSCALPPYLISGLSLGKAALLQAPRRLRSLRRHTLLLPNSAALGGASRSPSPPLFASEALISPSSDFLGVFVGRARLSLVPSPVVANSSLVHACSLFGHAYLLDTALTFARYQTPS
jgi:hypothetical protein